MSSNSVSICLSNDCSNMLGLKWLRYRRLFPALVVIFTCLFVLRTTRLMSSLSDNQTNSELRFGYSLTKVSSLEHLRETGSSFEFQKQKGFPGIKDNSNIPNWAPGKINQSSVDRSSKGNLFLTILVISSPNRVLYRQAIRKTWGRTIREWDSEIKFVVGRHEDWDDIVDRESRMHGDLFVIEEQDTPDNLPNKVLDGFTRVMENKTWPKFVMKTDDDTFLNIPFLMQELYLGVVNTTSIMGSVCRDHSVSRNFTDQWALSELDYPFSIFPAHVFGGAYVTSSAVVDAILRSRATIFDWIHLEDVYITGILAKKCGIALQHHRAFSPRHSKKTTACDFVTDRRINSVHVAEKEFFDFYADVQELLRTKNMSWCNSLIDMKS